MASKEYSLLCGAKVPQSNEKVDDVFRLLMKEIDREQPAVITGGEMLSYGDLDYKSDVIAMYLSKKSNESLQQPIIGIFMNISEESIISMLAVFKSQACYVPIDPCCPKDRFLYIIHKTNVSCILTTSCHTQKLKSYTDDNIAVYEIDSILSNPKARTTRNSLEGGNNHELACIIFTSGSTGEPKGVKLSHRNILNRIRWQWRVFPLASNEKVSAMTSLTFIDSITEVFPALLNGIAVVVMPRSLKSNPRSLLQHLKDYEVTRVVMVPTLLKLILAYIDTNDGISADMKIKLWVLSGEVLTKATLSKFFIRFPTSKLANYYGCTEVTGDVTSIVIDKTSFMEMGDAIPIGEPNDNTTVYIVNDGRLMEMGEKGEICISGLNVAMGYHEHITDTFSPNLFDDKENGHRIIYKTGDYGYIKDGLVYYVGRLDSQVKISGIRIELGEIEKALQSVSPIIDSAVIYHDAIGSTPLLLAFCVFNDESTHVEGIATKLKSVLPSAAIPRIVKLKELPVSVNGKIDKFALLKQYHDNLEKAKDKNVNEVLLMIRDVIGVDIDDELMCKTLYELGGTSLAIVEILIRMQAAGYCLNPIMLNICTLDVLGTLEKGVDLFPESNDMDDKFRFQEISQDVNFQAVSSVVAEAFTSKHHLDIAAKVKPEDHLFMMKEIWHKLIEDRYSFVVYNQRDEIAGVMINVDFFHEPEVQIPERLLPILLTHQILENRCRKMLEEPGKRWLHNVLLATNLSLTAAENVSLVVFMENKLLEHAKKHGFHGVFAINSSHVTQAVCNHILNYQEADDFNLHEFVYNGERLFAGVPANLKLIASYKRI